MLLATLKNPALTERPYRKFVNMRHPAISSMWTLTGHLLSATLTDSLWAPA